MMQRVGNVDAHEMYRAFNMGVGLVIIGDENIERQLHGVMESYSDLTLTTVGDVVTGDHVQLLNI